MKRHPLSADEANTVARAINAMNAERISGSEKAADVVVATIIGLLLALAVLHWATPCEGTGLCAAVITPTTRGGWLRRALLRLRRARLRWLLADAETALEWVESDLQELPATRQTLVWKIDVMRIELADAELALRRN